MPDGTHAPAGEALGRGGHAILPETVNPEGAAVPATSVPDVTKGALSSYRRVRRRSALSPLIVRSISNRASMRRTASSAGGEITLVVLPSALRQASAAISASMKNGRRACTQQPASIIGPGRRSASYSLL